ncbi:MAG: CPBP family intramembrane metalloprotease [Bdellovibrionales bacterium]|nr:CPBP family intramembrane metalloprotease [Bdellovibrionales bacterium]
MPIILIFAGLGLLALSPLAKQIQTPEWLFLLLAFLAFNLVIARLSGYWKNLMSAWSFKKIPYFILGFTFGLFPSGIVALWVLSKQEIIDIHFGGLTITSILVTLAIGNREELWFRGIALELGSSQYSKLGAAAIFGLLFLGLHALNPQINLFEHGLELFLAGYTLSLVYFLFNGIWAPIGMHFSNNIVDVLFKQNNINPIENNLSIYTAALAGLAVIFTYLERLKTQSKVKQ